MAASFLEFSLKTARCLQLPEWRLSEQSIRELDSWLRSKGSKWKLTTARSAPKTKTVKAKPADPRQLKLPGT